MRYIFSALCVFITLVVTVGRASAAVIAYTDEAEYLTAIAALGVPVVHEGFEDEAAWGSVRGSTAPGITNLGITWTANNANSGVTTGIGAALTGNYGFYTLPHGDFANGIGDGFVGTSNRVLYGVGGWIRTNTPPAGISLVLEADSNPVNVDFGEDCDPSGENCIDRAILGTAHKFFGVVSPDGFTRFDFLETEFTLPDELKLIFVDDFTIAGDLTVPVLGDMDCDGDLDFDDIDDFVLGINNPQEYENQFGVPPEAKGDADGDGDLDFDDIDDFVAILNNPLSVRTQYVPEPGTAVLLGVAMSILAWRRWRQRA